MKEWDENEAFNLEDLVVFNQELWLTLTVDLSRINRMCIRNDRPNYHSQKSGARIKRSAAKHWHLATTLRLSSDGTFSGVLLFEILGVYALRYLQDCQLPIGCRRWQEEMLCAVKICACEIW